MFNAYHLPDTPLGGRYTIVDRIDKAPRILILVHLSKAQNKGHFRLCLPQTVSNMDDFARRYIYIDTHIYMIPFFS